MTLDASIAQAARLLRQADALLIGAGAGIGVDSGLPDFRGDHGFWRVYPPLAARGIRFVEIADPHSFDANPALAWGFYGHRLALYRNTAASAPGARRRASWWCWSWAPAPMSRPCGACARRKVRR
jgi:NAD-dependent SIR2 family protein deacetylase